MLVFDIDIIVKLLEAITFIGHEEVIGTDIAIVKVSSSIYQLPVTAFKPLRLVAKLLSVMSILKVLVNDGFSTEVAVTVR